MMWCADAWRSCPASGAHFLHGVVMLLPELFLQGAAAQPLASLGHEASLIQISRVGWKSWDGMGGAKDGYYPHPCILLSLHSSSHHRLCVSLPAGASRVWLLPLWVLQTTARRVGPPGHLLSLPRLGHLACSAQLLHQGHPRQGRGPAMDQGTRTATCHASALAAGDTGKLCCGRSSCSASLLTRRCGGGEWKQGWLWRAQVHAFLGYSWAAAQKVCQQVHGPVLPVELTPAVRLSGHLCITNPPSLS